MKKDTLHDRKPNAFSAQERLNNTDKNSSENDQPATTNKNGSGSFISESTIYSSIIFKKPHTPWFDWG